MKDIQWNLSILALQIKDTSIIQMAIDNPKRSAIETPRALCSVLAMDAADAVPNGHIALHFAFLSFHG